MKQGDFRAFYCNTTPVLVTSWLDEAKENICAKGYNVETKKPAPTICDHCQYKLLDSWIHDGHPDTLQVINRYHPGPRPYLTNQDFTDLDHPAHPGYHIWVTVVEQQEITSLVLFKKIDELLREAHQAGPVKYEDFMADGQSADKWSFNNVFLATRNLMDQAVHGTKLERFKNILTCFDMLKVKCLVEGIRRGGNVTASCPKLAFLLEKETIMLRELVKRWMALLEEQGECDRQMRSSELTRDDRESSFVR